MSFMAWNTHLATGIDIVDRQHRDLVERINQAAPILATHTGEEASAEVGALLDGLLDYAATHFRDEEALMTRLGMNAGALEHHRHAHEQFAARVRELTGDFTQGRDVGGVHLLSFLASWLILHILGEDQSMARQVRALEAGLTPEQAFATARGGELDPEPAALSHALVDNYTLLTRKNRELLLSNRELDLKRREIQRHNDNLEGLVRERTAELEHLAEDLRAARDQAEAGSRAKSRFLATMSHELRTPMNAILGYSRMLGDQGLPPAQDALARRVVKATDKLLEVLNDIIDYARLEGGEADGEAGDAGQTDFSLAGLLAQACEDGFAAARAKGLAVDLETDPSLPRRLCGDAARIQRVLRIFLDNAVKFTARGYIRVRVRGEPGDGDARLRFEVADSGIGVPQAMRERLFLPFMQADDSADRHFEGIGLGLALARAMARIMGGEVGFDSAADRGSTFWLALRLPVVQAAVVEAETTLVRAGTAPAALSSVDDQVTASGPLPEHLRATMRLLDKLLRASDTRAGALLEQAAPRLRPWLGGQVDVLARHIADFDYDGAAALLQTLSEHRKNTR